MLIIFWDQSEPIRRDMLQAGQTLSRQQLVRCNQVFYVTAVDKSFRFKTTQSHTLLRKQKEADRFELEAYELSTVFAGAVSIRFHLFRSLKYRLDKKKFRDISHPRRESTG
ncbi:hypothetical protein KIN20_022773 [Parelaphostrongylus tenuis]|uniref:Uncharacterized protein n=1 Tax=Parelaphostrongylus tenuis TaxID=148309 RepID=A0AAD5QVF6_PARTN|nr:hypothetical protein KIN20_022773 [Parelaphostrongylus tenuis]